MMPWNTEHSSHYHLNQSIRDNSEEILAWDLLMLPHRSRVFEGCWVLGSYFRHYSYTFLPAVCNLAQAAMILGSGEFLQSTELYID